MDITEVGNSIQIRILYDDAERLKSMKLVPQQPWHKALNNLLKEYDELKKENLVLKRQLRTHISELKKPHPTLPGNVQAIELKADQLE